MDETELGSASVSGEDATLLPGGDPTASTAQVVGLSQIGDTISRYELVSLLGKGGMGAVFRARDPQLARDVAIKILLREDASGGSSGTARLIREAQAVAQVRHPNVVTVFDVGADQGRVFIAMELIDGVTLRDWLKVPREPREIVEVMLEAAAGLQAAHDAGLVHRDFKPDNVLIERDGRPRVLDFGLARSSDVETQPDITETLERARELDTDQAQRLVTLTRTGALVGTPAYMAPEQFSMGPTDARTDQFAFCVTLFEALYGRRPFGGTTAGQLMMNVIRGELIRPENPGEVAPALLEVLERGLAVDAGQRFASMEALVEAIQEALARPARPPARRKFALWGLAAALLIAAPVGLVVALGPGSDSDDAELATAEAAITTEPAEPAEPAATEPTEPPAPAPQPAAPVEAPPANIEFDTGGVLAQVLDADGVTVLGSSDAAGGIALPFATSERTLILRADGYEDAEVEVVPDRARAIQVSLRKVKTSQRFRSWCFINTRSNDAADCSKTQRECEQQATNWLGPGRSRCRGKN